MYLLSMYERPKYRNILKFKKTYATSATMTSRYVDQIVIVHQPSLKKPLIIKFV